MVKNFFLMMLIVVFVGGCSALRSPAGGTPYTLNNPAQAKNQINSAHQPIEDQLLQAALSIEQSLGVLAATEKADNPPVFDSALLTTSEGGMGAKIDLEWTGPIGPLVQKIADLTHYRLKFLGKEPAIPILVSISVKATVIAEVLQNASLQAGKRASVLVFPSDKIIEVRYLQ